MGFFAYDQFAGEHFLPNLQHSRQPSSSSDSDPSHVKAAKWYGHGSTEDHVNIPSADSGGIGESESKLSIDVTRWKGRYNYQDHAGVWFRNLDEYTREESIYSKAQGQAVIEDHLYSSPEVETTELPGFCWGALVTSPRLHGMQLWTGSHPNNPNNPNNPPTK